MHVEIAIGILRAEPKEDVAPARGWAIDVIERDSGVKFSPEDRAALLLKPLNALATEDALRGQLSHRTSRPTSLEALFPYVSRAYQQGQSHSTFHRLIL